MDVYDLCVSGLGGLQILHSCFRGSRSLLTFDPCAHFGGESSTLLLLKGTGRCVGATQTIPGWVSRFRVCTRRFGRLLSIGISNMISTLSAATVLVVDAVRIVFVRTGPAVESNQERSKISQARWRYGPDDTKLCDVASKDCEVI